jgi:periplasmic protein TonB
MKSKKETFPGFDEIIFENRNKEYGAYDLRKRYLATSGFSLLGVLAACTVMVLIMSFTVDTESKTRPVIEIFIPQLPDPSLIDLDKVKPPEPELPKPGTPAPVNVEPVIVEKVDSTDIGMAANASLDSVRNKPVDPIIAPVENPDPVIPPDESKPRITVEEMPTFPGGESALLKYIAASIKYPEDAAANGIQGRVTVRFVVASDGSVKNVEILRSVHSALDEEAARVVTSLPKWKPGKQNGKAVPVYFSVPVNFKLKFN